MECLKLYSILQHISLLSNIPQHKHKVSMCPKLIFYSSQDKTFDQFINIVPFSGESLSYASS